MKNKLIILLALFVLFASCSKKASRVNTEPDSNKSLKKVIEKPIPPEEDIIREDSVVIKENKEIDQIKKYESKRFSLDLQSGDIKDVLLALVKDSDIGVVIDPGISGNIPVMDIKDATLKEILSYILKPLNLKYKWEGKNIHIYKDPLITRFFRFNYLSASRKGKRQVSFSTRSNEGGGMSGGSGGSTGSTGSSGGGSMGGQGGGQNQSTSEITVDYENSVWNTLIESLKTIVFGRIEVQSVNTSEQGSQSSGENKIKALAYADSSGKKLIISPETGIILLTAHESEINKVADFIEKYEGSAQRQVWIEAKILEVDLYSGYQMGINWGAVINRANYYGTLSNTRTLTSPAMNLNTGDVSFNELSQSAGSFQFAVSNNVIDVLIDALSLQGNLKVLASPRISTLNNEKAVIRVVREEVFFNLQTQIAQGVGGQVTAPTINVQVVPIGIVMDIVPQINKNGDIILSVNPDISELLEIRKIEVEGAMAMQPVIDRRSIDTIAKLKNGETLVIAGIIKERKNEIIKGIPFLYKLPVIGNLFRRTQQKVERTELVILITPKYVAGKDGKELTREEINRINKAIQPMRLGDVFSLKEGIKGEVKSLKKEKE